MLSRLTLAFGLSLAVTVACSGDDGDGGGNPDACYADREAMKGPTSGDLMDAWGSPCETNEDCVAVLGEGAICDNLAVVYELPGGYCTKPCIVGDDPNVNMSSVELDDPDCDPNGGVHCVGANGIFSRCAPPCSSDAECTRDGYFCTRMPQISEDGDPTFCLMDECCEGDCASAP